MAYTTGIQLENGSYAPWDNVNPNIVYSSNSNDTNQGTWTTAHSALYAIDISNGDLATNGRPSQPSIG